MASGAEGPIPVDQLSLPQLNSVKQQLEEELQQLTNAAQQLRVAQDKYSVAIDCINNLQKDKPTLVPLTETLFVPAVLEQVDSVLVDVGTGYFIEKSRDDAKDFYKRKVEYVKNNFDRLQKTISGKESAFQAVEQLMQMKISMAIQQQQQQKN